MKKTTFLSTCIIILSVIGTYAQSVKLNPFSQSELQQLKQQDGCGCYIYDANHVNSDTYLYGEAEPADKDFGIAGGDVAIYVKLFLILTPLNNYCVYQYLI